VRHVEGGSLPQSARLTHIISAGSAGSSHPDFDSVLARLCCYPDSRELDTFPRTKSASALPVVVLMVSRREHGPHAVQEGAQDYLVQGSVSPPGRSVELDGCALCHRGAAATRQLWRRTRRAREAKAAAEAARPWVVSQGAFFFLATGAEISGDARLTRYSSA